MVRTKHFSPAKVAHVSLALALAASAWSQAAEAGPRTGGGARPAVEVAKIGLDEPLRDSERRAASSLAQASQDRTLQGGALQDRAAQGGESQPEARQRPRWGYFVGPDRIEVTGGAQVADEVRIADERRGGSHTAHFNPGPSPYTHANDAESDLCSFTRNVGERPEEREGPGDELNPSFNCLHLVMNSTAPGRSFGDRHGASGGWLTQSLITGEATMDGRGIHALLNFTDYARGAGGDHTGLGITTWIKPAVTTPADEGHHSTRFDVHEESNMTGVVARGGRGATTLTFTRVANGSHVGVGHPLLDRTNEVLSCSAEAHRQNGGPGTVTLSGPGCRVGPSLALRLAEEVPVAPAMDGGSTLTTFAVSAPGCAAGSLVSTGGIYHEVARVADAGRDRQGRPVLTVPLEYSHAAGDPLWCGGPVDLFLEQRDYTVGGHRYVFSVLGGKDAETLVVGVQSAGYVDGRKLRSGPVNLYHGALIRDVRVPGRRDADGSRLVIGDNDAAWTQGSTVENTTHLANVYSEHHSFVQVFNPYAEFTFDHEHLSGVNGFVERQYAARLDLPTVDCTSMAACSGLGKGGLLQPMALRLIDNIGGGGDVWRFAPIGYGPQDHGFLTRVEALAPGVLRHDLDLYQLGTNGDTLTYNFDTRRLEYGGSPICTVATGCGASAGAPRGVEPEGRGSVPEGTPQAAFGPVAGASPSGLTVKGRNDSMVISYVSGAGSGGAGTLLTVAFSRPWEGVVSCQAAPNNLTTAALGSTFAMNASARGFTVAAVHAKGGGAVSLTVQCR